MTMPVFRWLWRAATLRVVDGDTFDLLVDRGFRATQIERVRLLNIDTPEVVGESKAAGLSAAAFVQEWLRFAAWALVEMDRVTPHDMPLGWPLLIETYQPRERDSFGRWLVDVWRVVDGHSLREDLIAAGHAVVKLGQAE